MIALQLFLSWPMGWQCENTALQGWLTRRTREAESKKQKAKGKRQKAKSKSPKAKSKEQRAKNKKQKAKRRGS